MKKYLFVLFVFVFASLLAGCGSSQQTAAPAEEAAVTAEAETVSEPKMGGSVTVGISNDLDTSLDPHTSTSAGKREIFYNIFEGLVKSDEDGNFVPALAESYEISDDAMLFTFHLRQGVKFHNGSDMTAEDVVYTLDRCRGTDTGVALLAAYAQIESVTATDDYTVEIKLSEPNIEFLAYLTTAVVPSDYDGQDTFPIGTGPFKYKSRSVQENIVLEKNSEYWGEPAYPDEVVFKIVENTDAMTLAMQSGSIDIAVHRVASDLENIDRAKYDLIETPSNIVQAMYLNNAVEPLNDIRVRQALNYAVNIDDVITMTNDGLGIPLGSSIYPSFGKYFMPELADAYPYDPEKAKSLLKEAGAEGMSLTITVPSNYTVHVNAAQVIAEELKAVGINAKINLVEWATWLSDVYQGRNFEATVVGFDASYLTARALLERFMSDNAKNMINFNNADYDVAMKAAFAATDDASQTEYYKTAEKILSDEAANVYLMDPNEITVVSKKLGGYVSYPMFVIDMSKVYYK